MDGFLIFQEIFLFVKNLAVASLISKSTRLASTVNHQIHSPSLCSSSGSVCSPFGQRPFYDMASLPTNPAPMRKQLPCSK